MQGKKSFLKVVLTICFVMLSSVLFVGCKEDRIDVESIEFQEQSIILVKNQTYKPNVLVLPSYSTNRNYYFSVGSNSNILEVDRDKIKAVGEGIAQLKVVSEDNEFLNDVISVRIIPEAIQLTPPKNLTFDGKNFTFSPVTDAMSYIISVNDKALNIGSSTSFSLEQVRNLLGSDPYGVNLNVKVSANGDENAIISSGYTETITALKLPEVKNVKIKDNVLTFNAIEKAEVYNLSISDQNQEVLNVKINNSEAKNGNISYSLAGKTELTGGNYKVKITASAENENVFSSDEYIHDFVALEKPKSFTILNFMLHWENVAHADSYTLQNGTGDVLKSNIRTNSLDIRELENLPQQNDFKLIAMVDNNLNVVYGTNFSDTITTEILAMPVVTRDERVLKWTTVEHATSYEITITNSSDVIVRHEIVTSNNYIIEDLDADEYKYTIRTLGNGKATQASLKSASGTFTILPEVSGLKVENETISWNASATADVQYELVITSGQSEIKKNNQSETTFSLGDLILNSGDYTAQVKVKKDGYLDSRTKSCAFYKLKDVEDLEINDCVITFKIDPKTNDTKAQYYKNSETGNKFDLNKVSNTQFSLDSSKLAVGEYTIVVMASGNNKEILDADNKQTIKVTKIDAPTLTVDKDNLKINRGNSQNAQSYMLYENDSEIPETTSENTYSLSELSAGDYTYSVKAIGNKKEILDSEVGEAKVKVLKLSTPTLDFDKTELKFTIGTTEDEFISNYDFKINGSANNIQVREKQVDVSDREKFFKTSGEYTAVVSAIAKESEGYNLVINSNAESLKITKIDPTATLTIKDRDVLVTPTKITDLSDKYSLTFKIGYGETPSQTYAEYGDVKLVESDFVMSVLDEKYKAIGPTKTEGRFVFEHGGTFDIKIVIASSDLYTLSSELSLGNITKLNGVSSITSDGENITFATLDKAKGYLYAIEDGGVVYYAESDNNTISIDDLASKMSEQGLNFKTNYTYNLNIVALGNDEGKTISSISETAFEFKILDVPNVAIVLNENEKCLSIENKVANANGYKLIFNDEKGGSLQKDLTIVAGDTTLFKLSESTGLNSGKVNVKVFATSTDVNTFKSRAKEVSYTILETPEVSVKDGLLTWTNDSLATSYNLFYTEGDQKKKISLYSGATGYKNEDGTITYDLTAISTGISQINVQAISVLSSENEFYMDSAESTNLSIKKLSSPEVKIENGEIKISLTSDEIQYISDIKIIGGGKEYSITDFVEEISESMTIHPEDLLQYLAGEEIEAEKFEIFALAKNEGVEEFGVLNSNVKSFEAKGLQSILNLKIKTTVDYDNNAESIDKITWEKNSLNDGHISGYIVKIVHNDEEHTYEIKDANTTTYTFPTEDDFKDGIYVISVKVLAGNESPYCNGKFSDTLTIEVCKAPSIVKTENGVLTWDKISSAESYIVKIYKAEELIKYVKVTENRFDFNTLESDVKAGLYSVTLQAINESNSLVVSSGISEKFDVVRLPEINKFYLEMGDLFVYTHSFVSRIKLTMTSSSQNASTREFYCNLNSNISDLKTDKNANTWKELNGEIDKLLSDESPADNKFKMSYIKFLMDFTSAQKTSIFALLCDGYTMAIEAIGNSTNEFMTVNSYTTHSDHSEELKNDNTDSTTLTKLKTPTGLIEKRGVVSWDLIDTEYTDLVYGELKNVLIYNVKISVLGKDHEFYAFQYIDLTSLPEGATLHTFNGREKHTYYGYVSYNNLNINVINYKDSEGEHKGALEIDFSKEEFNYIDKSGSLQTIDLTKGGNFDVSINIVGDDSNYLTSDNSDSVNVIRYPQLLLSIDDGMITWQNDRESSPIFLLEVSTSSEMNDDAYCIYLTGKNDIELQVNDKLPVYRAGKTYVQKIDMGGEKVRYSLDLFDNEKYIFESEKYVIKITTYYRDTTALNVLQSKTSPLVEVYKANRPTLNVVDGSLTWERISAGSEKQQYINNYEIQFDDGTASRSFIVDLKKYTLDKEKIKYDLLGEVDLTNGEKYTFTEGKSYTFSLFALGGEITSHVNSNASESVTASISTGVKNVILSENKLVWESDYASGSYEVYISYDSGNGNMVNIKQMTKDKSFSLPTTDVLDVSGQGRKLSANYEYNIQVRRIGSNNELSSFYSVAVSYERLKTIENDKIVTDDGVATWDDVTNLKGDKIDGVKYKIHFENSTHEDVIVETNRYDFAGINAGEIKFKITALHDGYFSSIEPDAFKSLYKLGVVDDLTSTGNGTIVDKISFSPIKVNEVYANKYLIKFEDKDSDNSVEKEFVPDDIDAEKISYNILDINFRQMQISIRAMVTTNDENKAILNGEWSEKYSLTMPESIDGTQFKINELNFEFRGIDSEESTDKYILTYNFKETGSNDTREGSVQVTNYYEISENDRQIKVYYWTPRTVGTYSNIGVTVTRAGSLSSQKVLLQENGVNKTYEFNKFEKGDGTSEKPYEIKDLSQLININLFKDAHYKLTQDISLQTHNKQLIDGVFSGVFDGDNKTLSNLTLESTSNMIGLFGELKGATIKNLKINYFETNVKSEYTSENNVGKKVYAGLLGGLATDTTFENISITYSQLNVDSKDSLDSLSDNNNSMFYFGGVAGYLDHSKVNNVSVQLGYKNSIDSQTKYCNITFTGWNRDLVYFGGVAGYMENSAITGNANQKNTISVYFETHIKMQTSHSTSPVVFIGGVVGAMDETNHNDDINSEIKDLEVSVHQNKSNYTGEVTYTAGVCAYAYYGTISGVSISGELGVQINTGSNSIFLGKLVAKATENVIKLENNEDKGINLVENSRYVVNDTINSNGN